MTIYSHIHGLHTSTVRTYKKSSNSHQTLFPSQRGGVWGRDYSYIQSCIGKERAIFEFGLGSGRVKGQAHKVNPFFTSYIRSHFHEPRVLSHTWKFNFGLGSLRRILTEKTTQVIVTRNAASFSRPLCKSLLH